MKKNYVRLFVAGAMSGVLLTSCFDKNYDLDDMDKTTQISVNGLELPLNIDDVKFKSIIDLDDTETIQVVDGKYCFVKEGSFSSSPVDIDPITLKCDPIEPSTKDFPKGEYPATVVPGMTITLQVGSKPTPFNLETNSVPDCILGIDEVGCNLKITITMGLEGLGKHLKGFTIHDDAGMDKGFTIHLPKGLKDVKGEGTYYADGRYVVPARHYSGSSVNLDITVGRVNLKEAGAKFNAATHTLVFADNLSVDYSTRISFTSEDLDITEMPNKITYFTKFKIHDMSIESFTGDFRYDIENLDIPRLSLDGIPDVLSEEGSNLELVNPQLYLSVKNPVPGNPVKAETGMTVSAVRDDKVSAKYTMKTPLEIKALAEADYCLCPNPDALKSFAPGYSNAYTHKFEDLGKILSGNGVPEALEINLVNPVLPAQHVVDMKVGSKLGKVEGKYCFFAPLELAPGSVIKYAADSDGWFGDDMDDLEISLLSISADIDTDVPVSLNFTGYPLNRDGEKIPGVKVNDVTIPANAKDAHIELIVEGDLKDLDGMHYVATAAAGSDPKALSEDMKIILRNVRVKVTGKYTTDFE